MFSDLVISEKCGLLFFFFLLFRAALMAYGDSQARGLIGAVAASIHLCSRQHWILNPLSKARDRAHNLMVPNWIHFLCATMGTPKCGLLLKNMFFKKIQIHVTVHILILIWCIWHLVSPF